MKKVLLIFVMLLLAAAGAVLYRSTAQTSYVPTAQLCCQWIQGALFDCGIRYRTRPAVTFRIRLFRTLWTFANFARQRPADAVR
jgi:hypothetical protein